MKGKVYIRGKVTGLDPDVYTANFKKAEELLLKAGYAVVNPVKMISELPTYCHQWSIAMRYCINELILCDYYYSLPNSKDSRGARLEKHIADELGIPELKIKNAELKGYE